MHVQLLIAVCVMLLHRADSQGSFVNCQFEYVLASPYTFTSPGYPNNYVTNINLCAQSSSSPGSTHIIRFDAMDLDAGDTVAIGQVVPNTETLTWQDYSGGDAMPTEDILIPSRSVIIWFTSDGTTSSNSGFNLTIIVVDTGYSNTDDCVTMLDSEAFASPVLPGGTTYPANSEACWIGTCTRYFSFITVEFSALCTEEDWDWVLLMDGDDTGDALMEHEGCAATAAPVSFNTSGSSFIARLSTDHGGLSAGFQAEFSCTDLPYDTVIPIAEVTTEFIDQDEETTVPISGTPDPCDLADAHCNTDDSSSSVNVGAIVGGVIGGLVLLGLAAFLIFFLIMKKKKRERKVEDVNNNTAE